MPSAAPAPHAPVPSTPALHPRLQGLAAEHGGVFTRTEALDCGYTERQLKTLLAPRGAWVRVRRGVYAERRLVEPLGDDDRYLLRVRAVALTADTEAVTSHTGAAAAHGMPLRPRWRELTHLTRDGVHGGRTENGVKHHRASLQDRDVVTAAGLTVTALGRTAVDVAREHGVVDGVVAADAALRLGAPRDDLVRAVEEGRNWPHNTWARAAVEIADGGAQTLGETLLRLLVLELGIGRPETQYRISEDGWTVYADLRVGRHLFEFDGRVKYVGRDRGGVADRSVEDVLWDEKQREDFMRRACGGHGISRVIWAQLFGAERDRTKRRLLAEYLQTVRRFGLA